MNSAKGPPVGAQEAAPSSPLVGRLRCGERRPHTWNQVPRASRHEQHSLQTSPCDRVKWCLRSDKLHLWFSKEIFFVCVKNDLSWHKIIGKYHGYLNKTHQK